MANSKRTAIKRNKPSAPTQFLMKQELIRKDEDVLDFGCGRGDDVTHYGFDGYDPYFEEYSSYPDQQYDKIICNYVLNVVPEFTQIRILQQIMELLKPHGIAFITVRRDITENYVNRYGVEQRVVHLPYLSIHRTNGYEIYMVVKTAPR